MPTKTPPPPPHPLRPAAGPPLPNDGGPLGRHLRRHPGLRRRRDPRHALALAPLQDDPPPVARLLPARHAPLGARVLLVLRVLLVPLPPPPRHPLRRPPSAPPPVGPPAPAVGADPDGLFMARVLAVQPGARHRLHHVGLVARLRVPLLDGAGAPRRLLPICPRLPRGPRRLQCGVSPCCSVSTLLPRRRLQRLRRLAPQLPPQRRFSRRLLLLELLRQARAASRGGPPRPRRRRVSSQQPTPPSQAPLVNCNWVLWRPLCLFRDASNPWRATAMVGDWRKKRLYVGDPGLVHKFWLDMALSHRALTNVSTIKSYKVVAIL